VNGKERAVLWIGLILVALNLAMRWPEIRSVIFSGSGSTGSGSGSGGSGGSSGPSITVPIDPFIQGPTVPKITIPLSKPVTTKA
jgi:hypothetical protein